MTRYPAPRFDGLTPASATASRTKQANRRTDTACEQALRSALWRMGLRFRKNVRALPGKPDVVFTRHRLAVYCDGDFWHGRGWAARKNKLQAGHNSSYWLAKIQANRDRDKRHQAQLEERGWTVLRLWETDILRDPQAAAALVQEQLRMLEGVKGG